MKLLYFIDTINGGGAARLLSLLTSELVDRAYDIVIASNFNIDSIYDFDTRIKRVQLYPENYKQRNKLVRVIGLCKRIRNIISTERPDIVISFVPHLSLFSRLSGVFLNTKYIFADQTSFARKEDRFTHFVRWHFYQFADAITLLTNNDVKILGSRFKNKVVIYNPLTFPIINEVTHRNKSILVIGSSRIWHVKGLDLMIESWSKIYSKYPDWTLDIYGRREEKGDEYLSKLIKEKGIEEISIRFHGTTDKIDEVMRSSSIYALTSRIEGFSLSLIEAISQGCPCIAYKSHGVITEVSEQGKGVVLIEDNDTDQFARELSNLIEDEDRRQRLSEEGRQMVKKYSLKNIVDQWEALFNSLIK